MVQPQLTGYPLLSRKGYPYIRVAIYPKHLITDAFNNFCWPFRPPITNWGPYGSDKYHLAVRGHPLYSDWPLRPAKDLLVAIGRLCLVVACGHKNYIGVLSEGKGTCQPDRN